MLAYIGQMNSDYIDYFSNAHLLFSQKSQDHQSGGVCQGLADFGMDLEYFCIYDFHYLLVSHLCNFTT